MTEWEPGQRVLLVNYGWTTLATEDVIERLTKTQIITKRGKRFNRRTEQEVGREYGDHLLALDSERAQSVLLEARKRKADIAIDQAADAFRRDRTPENVNAIALAVQYWEFLHDGSGQ